MALPGNLTLRAVEGTYLSLDGTPVTGTVEFTITPVLTDPSAKVVILPTPLIAKLDAEGHFSKMVLTTDDPDASPTGFRYKVVEQFTGVAGRTFYLDVPGDSTEPIDLSNVATSSPPSDGTVSYATASALTAEIAARAQGDNELAARVPDIINAGGFPYFVKCDDVTDDTSALQTALYSCPPGGIVTLPVGKCRTSEPIIIPPHVTLQHSHANGEQLPTDTPPESSIKPLPVFAGDAVIKINDKLTGAYAEESREQRIYNVSIDGSDLATVVDGIKIYGYVQSVNLRDVCIWKVTGNGIICLVNGDVTSGSQAPLAMKWERVLAYEVGQTGFIAFNCTDSTFTDVIALGCNADGWYLEGPANTTLTACRAEWSTGDGFKIQPKFGPVTLIGCSTDRSDFNGIHVMGGDFDSSVIISGARLNRDGRNGGAGGGGYAGLRVESNCPVLVDGILVNARRDDNTTGPLGPDYGVAIANSQEVVLESGFLNAALAGVQDLGGNATILRGVNVEEKIGNMIGTALVRKRGIRSTPSAVSFFDPTGKETNLLTPPTYTPRDQGLVAWTNDLAACIGSQRVDSGVVYLMRVKVDVESTVSKIGVGVLDAGAGLTAGQNFAGLYDATGALLRKTADQSTAWTTAGPKVMNLSSAVLLAPGYYWIALLSVGTTRPGFSYTGAVDGAILNMGTTATTLRYAAFGAGLTDLPANIAPGAMFANWMALAGTLIA